VKRLYLGIKLTLEICLLLLLTPAIVAKVPVNAQTTTIHAINPTTGDNQFIFYTNTTNVGDEFTVNITLTDFVDVYTWQIRLLFDPALLNVTGASYPSDHIFAGETTSPVAPNIGTGYVLFGNSLVGDVPGKTGAEARLCQIEFKIKTAPGPFDPPFTCELQFFFGVGGTFIINYDGVKSELTPEHGHYEYINVTPKPWLEVVPNLLVIMNRSEFTIDLYIRELSEDWHLVAVQLKLVYNTTLLQFVNATEGPFMPSFAPYGTFPIIIPEDNNIILGNIVFPNATGQWDLPEFPNGEGILFTLTFKPLYFTPATDTFTIEPLNNLFFVNENDNIIPYEEPVSGTYETNYEVLIHEIDYPPYTFYVETISDKLVSTMIFNQTGSYLHFNVTQYYSWEGFVNVTLPNDLMWLENPETDQWVILVNDVQVIPIVSENDTHTTLHIPLNFTDTGQVYIFSTSVVSEYSIVTLMTIFLVFTLAALVMSKRWRQKPCL